MKVGSGPALGMRQAMGPALREFGGESDAAFVAIASTWAIPPFTLHKAKKAPHCSAVSCVLVICQSHPVFATRTPGRHFEEKMREAGEGSRQGAPNAGS